MHYARINRLIQVMREKEAEGKQLNMSSWLGGEIDETWINGPVSEELNAYAREHNHADNGRTLKHGFCGTTACMAGYGALDPELNAQGLKIAVFSTHRNGTQFPFVVYRDKTTYEAMAEFLEIPDTHSEILFGDNSLSCALRQSRDWRNDFQDAISLLTDYRDDPQGLVDAAYEANGGDADDDGDED